MKLEDSPLSTDYLVALPAGTGKPMLQLRLGHATGSVPGKNNEDFYGIVTPDQEPEAATRGISVALADGVSGNGSGRLASETTVRSLLRDFYAVPAGWNIPYAVDKLLRAINDWLLSGNARHPELEGVVSTLSLILFRDNHYYLAHVGDTRVYRKRGTVFKQLTIDHTWSRSDMRHVLKRAVGLDSHLVVDYTDGELIPGDTFVVASDGVWEVLGDKLLREALEVGRSAQAVAEALVARSLEHQAGYMGRNDATAIVATVEALVPTR